MTRGQTKPERLLGKGNETPKDCHHEEQSDVVIHLEFGE
jgi:hypothetical protein